MARLLYCRFVDCHEAYLSEAGKVPDVCPACSREAMWTTERPIGLPPPSEVYPEDPVKPYELSDWDRRLLKQLHISS